MTFASSKFITLAGIEETTYGVIPVSGSMKFLPFTDVSLNLTKDTITSNTIDQTRQTKDLIATGFQVGGGFGFEFAPKVYDELIEGAMWTRWGTATILTCTLSMVASTKTITAAVTANPFAQIVAGQYIQIAGMVNAGNNGIFKVASKTSSTVLVLGAGYSFVNETSTPTVAIRANMIRNPATASAGTKISYFMEKALNDLSPVERFSYSGALINSFSLNVQSKAIATGSFDMMGQASTIYSTGTLSPSAITAAISTGIFNSMSHVGGVRLNGVLLNASGTYVNGIDLSIGHSLRGVAALGYAGNVAVNPGLIAVTGKISPYFSDETMYAKFVSGEKFSLSFELLDGNQGYIFSFPNVAIANEDMGGEDIVENISFSAVMDPTYSTSMQIDRFYTLYSDCPDAPISYVGA